MPCDTGTASRFAATYRVGTAEHSLVPFEAVAVKLTEDDDREFWQSALSVLTEEFLRRYDVEAKNRE